MRERLRRCAGVALLGVSLSLSLLVGCGSANRTVLTVPQTQLSLSGAGSLTAAITEITTLYGARTNTRFALTFKSSGLLRQRIEADARPDIFTSADTGNPAALHAEGLGGPVVTFIRNAMCAIARPGLPITTATVLDVLLDPSVKLATSTPVADPAGDYAEAIFAKADAMRPGSKAILDAKALRLVGGPSSPPVPAGQDATSYFLTNGTADLFLLYCSGGQASAQITPGLQVIALPPALAILGDYGYTIVAGAPPATQAFAAFLLAPEAQQIFVKHGFTALAAPSGGGSPSPASSQVTAVPTR